uniref:Uncharacterized protein n=1 Tax=Paulinella micropora TaxID=1928728 RepID=A0A385I021_9EUKA|nr:hypothetical protein PMNZ_279 [Paulinella micropora]AXY63225.1 hypothetical protein PMNZ_279 [Paulinella micropora]
MKLLDKRTSQLTIAFAHLGCEKNRVDTEHMLGLLAAAGYRISTDENKASLVIVNTCSFIQSAREESIQTLVELAEQGKELIIAGCLAQHFQTELLNYLPEAKAIIGTGDYQHIVGILEKVEAGERINQVSQNAIFIADEYVPRYRTTINAVAYLKISEGCDYNCAFCIIPKLRGRQRSRSIESIVAEANNLALQGVQELILISQITTNYGLDLYGKPRLTELLQALGEVKIPWIRVHYAYPTGLTPAVLTAYRETPNILPYLDLPLQHSHPHMLKAMNRPSQATINDSILLSIRRHLPEAVLRTTFITGFPGERQEHFEHLITFVEKHQFDHVGVFTFSPEDGTPAIKLDDHIPHEIAEARKEQLMKVQQPISAAHNKKLIGNTIDVLIEKDQPSSRAILGRCYRFAPDVDGEVHVMTERDGACIKPGQIVPVRVTGADTYDLQGVLVNIDDIDKN